VDALVHEGDAYYALNRCPDSEAAYQLALQHDPSSTAAETGLGRCLIKTDPVAAEAALVLAVRDDPGNADALNDLGIARDLQGNFAGAVDPYRKALLAAPGMTAAEVNLGLSLALSGNGPAALQYLGPLATGPGANAKTREDYAAALVAVGRLDEARRVLSVDLPPDQVSSAISGFQAVIANAQAPLAESSPPPPPPTTPEAVTQPVQTAALTPAAAPPGPAVSPPDAAAGGSAPLTPAPPPPVPDIVAPPTDNAPSDPNAAYSGPSPIPGAVSSSAGDATAPPPAALPAPADTPDTAGAGSYEVQLGALASQDDAQAQWDRISGAMPALFANMQPDIKTATVNGRLYYRLRTGSFTSKADAAKFCGEVSAAGNPCTVANF
jgi:Flp pilus assembly protein TadD